MTEPAGQPATPLRTWRPMVLWSAAILLAVGLAWFLLPLALHRHAQPKRTTVPESGPPLSDGPVLLNVDGAGYEIGDIVELRTNIGQIAIGDVVLWDRRVPLQHSGWGPVYRLGEVVGVPGDRLKKADFPGIGDARDGADSFLLAAGDYLVESKRGAYLVKAASLAAVVVRKLGHDDEAAKEISGRRY